MAKVLFELKDEVIRWPDNTDKMVSEFFSIAGFPSVAGCMDGTHVDVIPPGKAQKCSNVDSKNALMLILKEKERERERERNALM